MKQTKPSSRLALASLALVGLALSSAACDKKLKEAEETRQELIEEVGGAPKAQVDAARDRINAAAGKYQQAADTATAVSED